MIDDTIPYAQQGDVEILPQPITVPPTAIGDYLSNVYTLALIDIEGVSNDVDQMSTALFMNRGSKVNKLCSYPVTPLRFLQCYNELGSATSHTCWI